MNAAREIRGIPEGTAPLFQLPAACFVIGFTAEKSWHMAGREARYRGKLGARLKHSCCPFLNDRERPCTGCSLFAHCPYPPLFRPVIRSPRNGEGKEAGAEISAPPPFVFSFCCDDGEMIPGQRGTIVIHLFGKAVPHAAVFMEAAAFALSAWPLRIDHIDQRFPKDFPDSGETPLLAHWIDPVSERLRERMVLRFVTPVRLTKESRVVNTDIDFPLILRTIIRRLRDLKRAHAMDGGLGSVDHGFYAEAESVETLENRLVWVRRKRFSYRQKQSVYLDGFEGKVAFAGPLHSYYSLLRAGELIHIGKGTSNGNGRFEIL